jgi:hypothetical protein
VISTADQSFSPIRGPLFPSVLHLFSTALSGQIPLAPMAWGERDRIRQSWLTSLLWLSAPWVPGDAPAGIALPKAVSS